jgi:PAS domain S-box-containing protein
LFKALVVNSTDTFQLVDEELKVLYVSESVKNVLGYEKSELEETHFLI